METKAKRHFAESSFPDTSYTKATARELLPKVGDKLEKKSNVTNKEESDNPKLRDNKTRPCVVEYVNTEHLWYQVRFDDTGFRECYKVPEQ